MNNVQRAMQDAEFKQVLEENWPDTAGSAIDEYFVWILERRYPPSEQPMDVDGGSPSPPKATGSRRKATQVTEAARSPPPKRRRVSDKTSAGVAESTRKDMELGAGSKVRSRIERNADGHETRLPYRRPQTRSVMGPDSGRMLGGEECGGCRRWERGRRGETRRQRAIDLD